MSCIHSSVLLNRLWNNFFYNKNFIIKAGYPVLKRQLQNECFLVSVDVDKHFNNTLWTCSNVDQYYKDQKKRAEILKLYLYNNYYKYKSKKKNIDIPIYKNEIHSSVLLNRIRTDFEYNKNFIIKAGLPVLDNVIDKYCIFTENFDTEPALYYNQTEWTIEDKKKFYNDHSDRLQNLRKLRQLMWC